jgi:hypothetical protein
VLFSNKIVPNTVLSCRSKNKIRHGDCIDSLSAKGTASHDYYLTAFSLESTSQIATYYLFCNDGDQKAMLNLVQ